MDRQSYYYNLIISNATISPDSSPRTSFCTGRIWGAVCWCRWACWSRRRSPRSSPRARPAAGPGPRPGPGRAGAGAGCPPWGCRGSGWTARAATCSTNMSVSCVVLMAAQAAGSNQIRSIRRHCSGADLAVARGGDIWTPGRRLSSNSGGLALLFIIESSVIV